MLDRETHTLRTYKMMCVSIKRMFMFMCGTQKEITSNLANFGYVFKFSFAYFNKLRLLRQLCGNVFTGRHSRFSSTLTSIRSSFAEIEFLKLTLNLGITVLLQDSFAIVINLHLSRGTRKSVVSFYNHYSRNIYTFAVCL